MNAAFKSRYAVVFALYAAFLLLFRAGAGERIDTIEDLNGKRLGLITGTSLDTSANEALDFTQIFYYENNDHEIQALLDGEVDAVVTDEPIARYLAGIDPRLRRLDGILIEDRYGFAVRPGDHDLHRLVNTALNEIMRDGTLADMEARWLDSSDENTRVLPELPPASGPELRLAVSSISAPFCYIKDGQLTGLDIELMERLARRIGRTLVIVDKEFSALIPSLMSGEVDLIGSLFSITPERERTLLFTDSYYSGGVAALVLSDAYLDEAGKK